MWPRAMSVKVGKIRNVKIIETGKKKTGKARGVSINDVIVTAVLILLSYFVLRDLALPQMFPTKSVKNISAAKNYQVSPEELPSMLLAPAGVATMAERMSFENKLRELILNKGNIYGIRNLVDKKEDYGEYGTAFLIDSGILATANHILQPPRAIEILRENQWKSIRVMGEIHTKDVAFLRLHPSYFSNLVRLKSAKEIFDSFPKGGKTVPLENVIVGMRCMAFEESRFVFGELSGWYVNTGELWIVVKVDTGGCSGTAVYMLDGSIIGIFQSRTGFYDKALDIGEVSQALKVIVGHEAGAVQTANK